MRKASERSPTYLHLTAVRPPITVIARACAGQRRAGSFEIEVAMGHGMFLA